MSGSVLDLEPKRLWYYFNEICKIPHGSENEAGLVAYIVKFAGDHGLESSVDEMGNLVVRKPATSSAASKPIVLQGHLDMVCEAAPNTTVDFSKDPIKPVINGEWVRAEGTTLGADNGIGNAACLAILESKDMIHGPLECLFTVCEETGLDGAQALKADFVKGRTMINLDTEVDGVLYVGCAGGEFPVVEPPFKRVPVPAGYKGLEISVSGLLGGHSGLMIHLQRGNAVKLLGRILGGVRDKYDMILSDIKGGTKHNVIPSEANAVIAVRDGDKSSIQKLVFEIASQIKGELAAADPNCKTEVKDATLKDVVEKGASDKFVFFINAAPHGVIKMSHDIEGMVQTSFNFAVVRTESDHFYVQTSTRSSVDSEMGAVRSGFSSLAKLIGSEVKISGGYPGWPSNLKSPIFKLAKGVYREMFGEEPHVTAIHAGLECGVVGKKYPGMDMVSVGPQIEGAHSVDERVDIKSVAKFWKYLVKVLEEFAKV